MCTFEGYPIATWLTDSDATALEHGIRCKKITALDAARLARSVWTVIKYLRLPPPV